MRTGCRQVLFICVGVMGLHAAVIRPVCPSSLTLSGPVEFGMTIQVENVTNLFGVSFVLAFDPDYLRLLSDAPGSFLGSDAIYFSRSDQTLGQLAVGITQKRGYAGASGSGTLVSLRCNLYRLPDFNGQDFVFSLLDVQGYDPEGNPIPLTSVEGRMTVYLFSAVGAGAGMAPVTWSLEQNYPNPFNGETEIRFTVPVPAPVLLTLYDARGRSVQILAEGFFSPGEHTIRLDGSTLDSGVYTYQLRSRGGQFTRRMLLVK